MFDNGFDEALIKGAAVRFALVRYSARCAAAIRAADLEKGKGIFTLGKKTGGRRDICNEKH